MSKEIENKPIVNEVFADNGSHSHWEVVDSNNGKILWAGSDEQPSSGLTDVIKEIEDGRAALNHAFDNGLNVSNKNNPSMCRAIVQVGIDGQKINDYPSLMEAHRQTGFKHSNIHYAIKNKIIRYGYYWKYKEAI